MAKVKIVKELPKAKNYKRRTVDMITSAHLYKNERSLTYK